MSIITPSQTVGPYFAIGLTPESLEINWISSITNDLVTPDVSGERIKIDGRGFDGDGEPLTYCLPEMWQAHASGRDAHPADGRAPNAAFKGFGRAATNAAGHYLFRTIKPGQVLGPKDVLQAPHIVLAVFARGMLRQQYARIYFADEPANVRDPVLALVPEVRRSTLMATPQPGTDPVVYQFDIHLQGDLETVFFDV